jgi:hypothetical protein
VIVGYPVNGTADELALRMLGEVLDPDEFTLEIVSARLLSSELIATVRELGATTVCIGDLPPSPPSKTRYMVKKLRAALPDVDVLVGRWAPPSLADDGPGLLLDAGARHVGATLLETRDDLQARRRETHRPELAPAVPAAGAAASA